MNFVEKTIAKRLFDDLIAAGHKITVDYGEDEIPLDESTDWEAVREASDAVDECWWLLGKQVDFRYHTFVLLVWGNGRDCISDYGVSLEPIIGPIFDWIDKERM